MVEVLRHRLEHPAVALRDLLRGVGGVLLGEEPLEQLELHLEAPELVGLGLVLRPGRLAAVGEDALVLREVDRGLEDLVDVGLPLAEALQEAVVDVAGGGDVAGQGQLVELGAVLLLELVEVGLEEDHVAVVEHVLVHLEEEVRHRVVERALQVVGALQDLGDDLADLAVLAVGGEGRGGAGRGGRGGGARLVEGHRGLVGGGLGDGGRRHGRGLGRRGGCLGAERERGERDERQGSQRGKGEEKAFHGGDQRETSPR